MITLLCVLIDPHDPVTRWPLTDVSFLVHCAKPFCSAHDSVLGWPLSVRLIFPFGGYGGVLPLIFFGGPIALGSRNGGRFALPKPLSLRIVPVLCYPLFLGDFASREKK